MMDFQACGTTVQTMRDTAIAEFNINNVPNNGNDYYLTYYMTYNTNVTQGADKFELYVNNVLEDSNYSLINTIKDQWKYFYVKLNPGNNDIKFEFTMDDQDINAQGSLYIDNLQLKKNIIETFENGSNTKFSYSGDWSITSADKYQGSYSYTNSDIGDGGDSSTIFTVPDIPNDGYQYYLDFEYETSSEEDYDFFQVYNNSNLIFEDSGTGYGWKNYDLPLSAGNNNIQFTYSKDGSVSVGNDCVYVDYMYIKKGTLTTPVITQSTSDQTKVTISYSSAATTKQYSLDGTNWSNYTGTITLPNTPITVYAKSSDFVGNVVSSTLYIVAKANAAVAEGSTGTPLTINSTIDGYTPMYYEPIIPAGFFAVNTDGANWNNLSSNWGNGLVIQDNYGNQFVWVPVNGSIPYAKWCTQGVLYSNTSDDTFPEGLNETTLTNKYQGFYIGRYEAGFDYNGGSLRATEKKSTNKTTTDWSSTRNSAHTGYLWNFINYTDAKSYAESMDTSYSYDTTKIGTNLVTGTQWDTTMKWIQNVSISVTDSRAWGNYSDSIAPANVSGYGALEISGYSTNWRAKNVYDLAGNVCEWSNEKYSTNYVRRGGYYTYNGANVPAAWRNGINATSSDYNIGLRSAIYIK